MSKVQCSFAMLAASSIVADEERQTEKDFIKSQSSNFALYKFIMYNRKQHERNGIHSIV